MEAKEERDGRGEEGGSRTEAMWMWRRRGVREEEAETERGVRAWGESVEQRGIPYIIIHKKN